MPLPRYAEATRNATSLPPFQSVMDKDLRVPLGRQQQDQWCWASVALGIAAHFAAPNPARWKQQCSLVNDFLKANTPQENTDCCGPEGKKEPCNKARAVSRALSMAGHYMDYKEKTSFKALQNAIDRGEPVVLRIYRTTPGKTYYHFVVVDAYLGLSQTNGHLSIRNPDEPRHFVVSYETLHTKEFDSGWKWEFTFFTQPATRSEEYSTHGMDVEYHASPGK
jgi:hypothetical protein